MMPRDELKKFGRLLAEKGLTWGRSGNLSLRLGESSFLINARGSDLGTLGGDELTVCRIGNDRWEGTKPPSIEKELHRLIYQRQEGAKAIVHAHPFYATLISCTQTPLNTDLFPEAMAYLGDVVRVTYAHPGSRELAQAVAEKAASSEVLLLENHGTLVWGSSLDEAMLKTETLELLSRLVITARGAGIELNYLGEAVQEDFRRHLKRLSGLSGA
ncbi:MAG: class II aldolase/adducin family protein [Chloroflexota bacterium]